MDKLNIGVIGCGAHANRVHYPSLSAMQYVNIVVVCDLSREKAESTARFYSVPQVYVDSGEMIDCDEA